MQTTIALSAAVFALFISASVPAQPPWSVDGPVADHHAERRIERMTERLDLTPEQQEQIRSILETQQAKRQEALAAVRAEIDAVLTEAQRAKRDEQIGRRIERRSARIADRLDLTAEQEAELRTAMTESWGSDIRGSDEMHDRLSAILTEEQLAELEEMRVGRGHRSRGGCRK